MTSLDLLVLLLLRGGTNTSYLLSRRAGISLGGSLPALKRLLRQGLIREGKPGRRGRREFSLTRAGESELANIDHHLQAALAEPASDLESLLRLAVCAVVIGRNELAVGLLRKGAADFQARSEKGKDTIPELKQETAPADFYVVITSYCQTARLHADTSSLRFLASALGKRPAPTKARRSKRH